MSLLYVAQNLVKKVLTFHFVYDINSKLFRSIVLQPIKFVKIFYFRRKEYVHYFFEEGDPGA